MIDISPGPLHNAPCPPPLFCAMTALGNQPLPLFNTNPPPPYESVRLQPSDPDASTGSPGRKRWLTDFSGKGDELTLYQC